MDSEAVVNSASIYICGSRREMGGHHPRSLIAVKQGVTFTASAAGINVRGAQRIEPLAAAGVFPESSWSMILIVAEGLEWSY